MKKLFLFNLIFLILILYSSCSFGAYFLLFDEDNVDTRAASVEKLSDSQLPSVSFGNVYSGVLITDVHFGAQENECEKFLSWISAQFENEDSTLRPRFILCLGDIANSGSSKEYDEFNSFCEAVRKLASEKIGDSDFKIYSTIGNHDLYNNGWSNYKKQVFPYKTAYYFDSSNFSLGNFSFYFLDSANGTFGEKQRESFASVVKNDPNAKIVCTHYPIYAGGNALMTIQNTMERATFLTIFKKNNVKQVFEGHAHRTYGFDYSTFREDVTASFVRRYTWRLFTVDEVNKTVHSTVIEKE
ncbi:metallophosphoesterase family protein [Treponema zioleckii]|uniref:metallophosphoesterase family protein n=1 Tax=Treponema zioleckii TaxID=331680 RepID=UPI00168A9205|nr:metallophosphoesterase [Treponema zioleckii]